MAGLGDAFRRAHGSPDDVRARKAAAWEQTVVRAVLSVAGLPRAPLDRWLKEHTGPAGGSLTLAALRGVFPMPVHLEARRVPFAHKAFLFELIDLEFRRGDTTDRFWKGRLYKEYAQVLDFSPAGRPVGMVFPYPKLRHMVVHDGGRPSRARGTFFVKTGKKREVVIEPFRQYVHNLLQAGWEPAPRGTD